MQTEQIAAAVQAAIRVHQSGGMSLCLRRLSSRTEPAVLMQGADADSSTGVAKEYFRRPQLYQTDHSATFVLSSVFGIDPTFGGKHGCHACPQL